MALPDSCPKCGEKATNDKGQCVFCGTQVTNPAHILTPEQASKAAANYRFASWSFVGVGSLYLLIGIVSSIVYKQPMIGLFLNGIISVAHGWLLIIKHEYVQSVTKVVCLVRVCLHFWIISFLIYAFVLAKLATSIMLGIVAYDIVCLLIMVKAIDDVYFG